MILPAVTVQRFLNQDSRPYLIVTKYGGIQGDEVTMFQGPNAEDRANSYASWRYDYAKNQSAAKDS